LTCIKKFGVKNTKKEEFILQMTATQIFTDNIPKTLREEKAWICWRFVERDGKMTKVPTSPFTGKDINAQNPQNWQSFERAISLSHRPGIDGIGFVFSEENDFVGVDIDHCVDDRGNLSQFAEEMVQALDSYTEISPSGTGIHIICRGELPEGKRKNSELGLEMYDADRYFTVTGDKIGIQSVAERTEELAEIYDRLIGRTIAGEVRKGRGERKLQRELEGDLDKDQILERMVRGKDGNKLRDLFEGDWGFYYESQSEADLRLVNALAFYTNGDQELMDELFRESALYRKKWDTVHYGSGMTYGDELIEKAIESTEWKPTRRTQIPTSLKPLDLPSWYTLNERGKPVLQAGTLADYLKEHIPALVNESGNYLYKNGVYVSIFKDFEYRKLIQNELLQDSMSLQQVNNVLGLWTPQIFRPIATMNGDDIAHLINFKNGIFDVERKAFMPHSPTVLTTIQLDAEYQPEATCPQFLAFIDEVLTPENIKVIQEILGYLLIPITKAQQSFVLWGPPRTGKSTFLNIVESIIGKQNVSNVPWQELGDRFKTALLYGKLVNVFADLPNKPIEDAGIFKALVGEDRLTGEVKYGHPFSFVNKARLLFSANELPKNLADRTDAFYRRLLIIPFVHQVAENQIDSKLTQKLLEEKSGIINWALEGLYRLMANGYRFSKSASSEQLKAQYKLESDSVLWFVNNYCEFVPSSRVQAGVLYETYKRKCEENGLSPFNHIRFARAVEQHFSSQVSKKMESGTKRTYYLGIQLL
jgi:putative DNA primase/helicase